MTDSIPNPIYDRLTRGDKGPSARAATWIGVGVALAGLAVAIVPLFISKRGGDVLPAAWFLGIAALLFSLCPPTAAASAAIITAHNRDDINLNPVHFDGLTADQVVTGYADSITYRLRVLKSIGFWSLPAGGVVVAFIVGSIVNTGDCFNAGGCYSPIANLVCGLLPAVLVVGLAMYAFRSFWRSMIHIGIWIGLHRAREVIMAAGLIALAALGVTVAGFLIARNQSGLLILLVCLFLPEIPPILILALGGAARRNAIRYFEMKLNHQVS